MRADLLGEVKRVMDKRLIDADKQTEWLIARANEISKEQSVTQDTDRWQYLNGEYYFIKELLVLINYSKFAPDPIPLPTIKPGDKVRYLGQEFNHIDTAKVDHLRVHTFGTYAFIKHDGEYYTVPLNHLEVSHD